MGDAYIAIVPKLSLRWLALLLLWVLPPIIILSLKLRLLMFIALWLSAGLLFVLLKRNQQLRWRQEWNWLGFKQGWRLVLSRFIILALIITPLVYWFKPDLFLNLPLNRPQLWALIMLIYPLFSVLPQELIYRSFLYHNYAAIWQKHSWLYPLASALTFGWLHIIFLNPVAVVMCLVGGCLFGQTYQQHKSLALVCFEHTLYGCLIFTIGLGQFFYSAGNWAH